MRSDALTDQQLYLIQDTRDGTYVCAGKQVIPKLYYKTGARATITKLMRHLRRNPYRLVPVSLTLGEGVQDAA